MGEWGAILKALDHGNGSCREDQPSATRSTHLTATCTITQLRSTQTGKMDENSIYPSQKPQEPITVRTHSSLHSTQTATRHDGNPCERMGFAMTLTILASNLVTDFGSKSNSSIRSHSACKARRSDAAGLRHQDVALCWVLIENHLRNSSEHGSRWVKEKSR